MLVAVDTGATKTLIAAFNKDGSVNDSMKFPTPRDVNEYAEIVIQTISTLCGDKMPELVCLALPGRIENGLLVSASNLGWEDIDFNKLLEPRLKAKILIENDANLAGLAETRVLNSIPKLSLYITVSTGIGTGVIVNGKLEPLLAGSEGGHIVLDYNGTPTEWEDFASGSAIYKRYGKYARDITSKRAWKTIAKDIACGIAAFAPILRPDIIIIGGSIGTYFSQYENELVGVLREQLPPHFIPKIKQAKHPEEAVIYGCYYYAVDQLTA